MRYVVKCSAAWTDEAIVFEKVVTRARKEDWTYEGAHDHVVAALTAALVAAPEGCAQASELTVRVEGR